MRTLSIVLLLGMTATAAWFGYRAAREPDHTDKTVAEWATSLDEGDLDERWQAAAMLAEYGADGVDPLVAHIGRFVGRPLAERPEVDAEDDSRRAAQAALVRIGPPAIGALLDAITWEEELERSIVASALLTISAAEPAAVVPFTDRLAELVAHENPMTGGYAAWLMIDTLGADAVAPLMARLEQDPGGAERVIQTLSVIPGGPSPASFLGDERTEVRLAALRILAATGRGHGDMARDLQSLLADPDADVRAWAAVLLEKAGPGVRDQLMFALDSESAEARVLAAGLLSTLGDDGRAAVPALEHALTDVDPQVRVAAAAAVLRLGSSEARALPVLLDGARQGSNVTRQAAIAALGLVEGGAQDVTPLLASLLESEEAEIAYAAARSLGQLGTKAEAAIPALELAERSVDSHLSLMATSALERVRGGADD